MRIAWLTYISFLRFFETLRLYPSVPNNQKYALKDDIWPDGTHVKAGTYVSWSSYAQGRSTKVWGEDAKEFHPERWLDENGNLKRESAGKWSAFHAGPRICLGNLNCHHLYSVTYSISPSPFLGQNLATLEALVCVSMLLRRYRFTLVPNQTVTYDISLTMPMKYGMKMFVGKRHKA